MKVLVVVDMQNDFVTDALGTAEAVAIVPAVVERVKQAREAGELVLFLAEKTGLCEALRRWSEETEYSTENVRILMNA